MNVVFYRPFAEIWFKNPSRRILRNENMPNKYEGLFDFLVNRGSASVSTSIMFRSGLAGWLDMLIDSMRLFLWVLLNRINPFKVKFVFTKRQFEKADAVVFMHYGCFTHENMELARRGAELAKYFASSKVKKIVHLTHYLYNPKVGADNLRALGPDLLVAENDLKANSKYFNRYFGDVAGAFYQLPYVAGARFDRRCTFGERVNKLGVTGSITYKLQDSEFTNFFGQGELQPMRRMLFEQRASIADQVDCLIYDLDESRRMLAEAELSGDTGKDVHAKINALQRAYYNTDIVEFFNRYTMFSVPEEICDLPGIGFIEGMACGTAYFGIDDPMYRAIGMIPGINYVAYDGTVSGLLEKITYYQVHSEELENIANLGYQFAHEAMSKNEVYLAMLARIEELIRGK